jgi:hypothetical protein
MPTFSYSHGTKIVALTLQFFVNQTQVPFDPRADIQKQLHFMLDEPVAGHWAY